MNTESGFLFLSFPHLGVPTSPGSSFLVNILRINGIMILQGRKEHAHHNHYRRSSHLDRIKGSWNRQGDCIRIRRNSDWNCGMEHVGNCRVCMVTVNDRCVLHHRYGILDDCTKIKVGELISIQ